MHNAAVSYKIKYWLITNNGIMFDDWKAFSNFLFKKWPMMHKYHLKNTNHKHISLCITTTQILVYKYIKEL